MEFKGTFNGAEVYDDYAHHPDEVRATIAAVRCMGKRIVLAFQPHTYTRTHALFNEFVEELSKAAAAEALPAIEIEPYAEEQVSFDEFCKCDLRVVKVKDCKPVKKSDKLLCFTLDDGTGTDRQILSGIAKFYKPEDLIGKTLAADELRHAALCRAHRKGRGETESGHAQRCHPCRRQAVLI